MILIILLGGGGVKNETRKLVKMFNSMPINPIPSGDIPKNQYSLEFISGYKNLK
tara:strand:- start:13 stop:174 length:162 start_codon:yes stop_codon:yes gene_type:complete